MEHEKSYQLMMDALDGELTTESRHWLETHLHTCSQCSREWQAVQAIDTLFRRSPILMPAADFTQRTLARLPNRTFRLWLTGVIYALLMLSGLFLVLGTAWAATTLRPVLGRPALFRGLVQSGEKLWQMGGTLLAALVQILSSLGEMMGQYPAVVGSFLLMLGIIAVWSGVYRQLLAQPLASRTVTNQ